MNQGDGAQQQGQEVALPQQAAEPQQQAAGEAAQQQGGGDAVAGPQQAAVPEDGAGGSQPAAAETPIADEEGPVFKKRRLKPPPDLSYEPKDAVDLVLKTSDSKRIGVHRLIVLRSCGFFRALLEACEETEVAVPEAYDDFKPHLLDIIYNRAVQIKPETAMKVFQLADKYEAPDIMQACRPVFMSDAFRMRIKPAPPTQTVGNFTFGGGSGTSLPHADWLDVLALASKHKYEDLFVKATEFLVEEAKGASKLAVEAATVLMGGKEQLSQLHQHHLLKLTASFAVCTHKVHEKMAERVGEAEKAAKASQDMAAKLEKQLKDKQKTYLKLLAKFNRLVNRCERERVNWHKELEPAPSAAKGKKGKTAAAAGAGQ